MTDYQIEMRIIADESQVREVESRLRECVADIDPRPKFKTIVHWLVVATDDLRSHPRDTQITRGASDWMPTAPKHKPMGRGPTA